MVPEQSEGTEAVRVKEPGVPVTPTADERRKHMLTHVPFRSWCDVCMRTKAVDKPHRRRETEEDVGLPRSTLSQRGGHR